MIDGGSMISFYPSVIMKSSLHTALLNEIPEWRPSCAGYLVCVESAHMCVGYSPIMWGFFKLT
jgi:hypothetical protein